MRVDKACWEKEECSGEVTRDMCIKRRMKQTLSDTGFVWRRAARGSLFSLLAYGVTERRKKG